jgi:hypothetical protein
MLAIEREMIPELIDEQPGQETDIGPALLEDGRGSGRTRKLFGRNRTAGGEVYRAVSGGEVNGKREGAGSLRIAAAQAVVK